MFSVSTNRISGSGKHAPPGAPDFGASFRAANRRQWAVWFSTQPGKQGGGRQRHQPEHQMAHHLGRAPHAPPASAVTLFEQTVHPFAGAAFLEPWRFGGREGELFSATRVGINDRHLAQGATEG